MISELLIGFFIQSRTPSDFKPAVKGESVIIQNNRTPSFTTRPIPRGSIRPTQTPKATTQPKASTIPKASKAPQNINTNASLTSQSVLKALNDYRGKNGVGSLSIDGKLQEYASSRAQHLKSLGKLDNHAGHKEFMSNDGFGKLGFNAIAENQGWNFKGDAAGLIESFYAKSSGHNKNQLNSDYTHVGIGISGAFTNLVFGGRKK